MQKKLIILNGPPRAGKDTAAAALWRFFPSVYWLRMSEPLKRGLQAMFDFTDEEMAELEASKGSTRTEDRKLPQLLDRTWPGAQISMSEAWAKVFFGPDVFGHIAARKIARSTSHMIVCSDAGFANEWTAPLRVVGRRNALLIRLGRSGSTYEGDSRSYINLDGVMTVYIHNDGEKRAFEAQIIEVVTEWLKL